MSFNPVEIPKESPRKESLKKTITEAETLLGQYEGQLLTANDPIAEKNVRDNIKKLKKNIQDFEQELRGLS